MKWCAVLIGAIGTGLSGDISDSIVNDRFGRITVVVWSVGGVFTNVGDGGSMEGGAIGGAIVLAGLITSPGFDGGVKKSRLMLVRAASSFSKISLSLLGSLNRFLLRSKLPLTNMSKAAGCNAQ